MTNWIEISARDSDKLGKSVTKKGRWQSYLLLGITTNLLFWISAFLYLKLTPPTYTSYSAINLPGISSSTNVNLPGIGQASYENVSPYASVSTQDPREIYKFIATSESVLQAAADQANMTLKEFGKPKLKVMVNTTIMTVEFDGNSPEAAQKKSLAFYKAFGAKLNEMRAQEASQQNTSYQTSLNTSKQKLERAQKSLSDYKARSGLNSEGQISDLANNIEQLRRQRAEILAQQQQSSTRLRELSANLKLSSQQATDAFLLQTDQVFQQNLKNYSEANANLVMLESKFLPSHPLVIAEEAKEDGAQKALLARSKSLIGRPVSLTELKQLNLTNNNSGSTGRENLVQQLVTVQADQKGLTVQAQTLDQQIGQLEDRLKNLTQKQSTLDSLKRDMQVAEAVFSSTVTKLDINKSNAFGSYPLVQNIIQPTLPGDPNSPKKLLVFVGSSLGSLFVSLGIGLHWWRSTQKLQIDQADNTQKKTIKR